MSEPLARARRVVAVGAASLAIVLVALAAAAWRLVDAEEASAAVRGRSAAALAVEDLVRGLAEESDTGKSPFMEISIDGVVTLPNEMYPPRRFDPTPPLGDAEGALLLAESEAWGPSLRRAALRRCLRSDDDATRLAAATAGSLLELSEGTGRVHDWAWAAGGWELLQRTHDGVLLRLIQSAHSGNGQAMSPRNDSPGDAAFAVIGSADDTAAAAMLATINPGSTREVQSRRARLAEVPTLLAAFRSASDVDGRLRARMLTGGDALGAKRLDVTWYVVRVPAAVVQDVARRTLEPRGMRLVAADAASLPVAVPFPGDGTWCVAASFSADETRSRSTLLLAGLGLAAAAAVAAFAVFARSVRREARLAALRTDFVATVSHELRTPVAVVRTSAETLASGRATRDEDRQALTEAIVRESERLSSLVGNVLDFSRMESGRRTYDVRPTDLGALVREVAARHAGVAVDVPADVPPVTCDADALGGALGNLLDNARKYSSPDAPVVARVARRGGDVVVEVEDRGIGVPDAEKPHVFERFFRGADARVRETRGAGIGLALVDHAARAHGGRVEVADTAGGGATFRIVLPRAQNG